MEFGVFGDKTRTEARVLDDWMTGYDCSAGKRVARALCCLFVFNLPFCNCCKGRDGDDFEGLLLRRLELL